MTTPTRKAIYVTQQGARVQRTDGMVAVAVDSAVLDRWPPDEIERLLLFGNVQITTQVLALLLANGIPVSLLSSSGRYRGQLVSPESGNVFVRLAQHARFADTPFRLEFARDLIDTKLRESRSLLRRYARNHPEQVEALGAIASRIDDSLTAVGTATDEDVLRGVEGAAAAAYFEGFDKMVQPPFSFGRRSKHPAHNEVNALLNLGYVMLSQEIAGRLETAGFDPRIGYFHGVRYGRSSLALDLLEAHRATVIDRLTLSVLNRKMLAPRDFEERGANAGVRLRPEPLKRYLALYEAALGDAAPGEDSPRTRIGAQVGALRHAVMTGRFDDDPAAAPALRQEPSVTNTDDDNEDE